MGNEYFERLSSDSEDESSEEMEVKVEDRIDPKWYALEATNEGEVEAKEVVAGDIKSRNDLQQAADNFIYNYEESAMSDALTAFNKMRKLAETHVRKFRELPDSVVECVGEMKDVTDSLTDKTRHDFNSGKDYDSLKLLVPAFVEFTMWVEQIVNSFQAPKEEEDEGDETVATEEDCIKLIKELVDNRRKKCGDFEKIATTCGRKGYIALQLTSLSLAADTLLESSRSAPTVSNIKGSLAIVTKLFDIIAAHPSVAVSEDSSEITSHKASLAGGMSELLYKIHLNLLRFAQTFNNNTTQYNAVPYLENELVDITDAVVGYYKERNNRRGEMRCYTILLDTLGPRRQGAHDILFKEMKRQRRNIVVSSVTESIRALYSVLSNDGEDKKKAICYIAYQLALSGKYREGRDFILRSGLISFLEDNDITEHIPLAILYNRALAQIGLTAFSLGDIDQSYFIFKRLWAIEHQDVQLGQSTPQRRLVSDDDELLNFRDNVLPLHFRIPSTHLELAALLSALVIDTLNEAKNPFERKNRCKFFHRAVGKGDSLGSTWYTTPVQDRIAAAYKALKVRGF
ncbi:translation initiation factor 3 subunit C [Strigomonas culicis]|uniref:Translation initiation factor 3 subunit C n=2 Tax=Strigomonas culicis TaxID=28005 RepID=S9WAF0_9TRYP|nr:translation initiation factor 3 subunit C [Strigomonas culicis]|eukprot:EPY32955.1 translation initiation factor 3 subunit C [Strigomonas culicis]